MEGKSIKYYYQLVRMYPMVWVSPVSVCKQLGVDDRMDPLVYLFCSFSRKHLALIAA